MALAASDSAAVVASRVSAPTCLDGLASWPNLDGILFRRAVVLMRAQGIDVWSAEGGYTRCDGIPTFGSPSRIGLEILSDIATRFGVFRYTDESGFAWWARIINDLPGRPGYWQAVAIGGDSISYLADANARLNCVDLIDRVSKTLQSPKQAWTTDDQQLRSRFFRFRRQSMLLDGAAKMLPVIAYFVAQTIAKETRIPAADLASAFWGLDRAVWPECWRVDVFDAIAAVASIKVRTLQLRKTGWCPRVIAQRAAVSNLGWKGRQTLGLNLNPTFVRFLQ